MSFVSLEECELYGDAKYRTYVAAVDKALKNFEYSTEWPDLISALGKLNKVVLSYANYAVIPRRLLISKRLAQCLHPSLPSGVHLKALETYNILFKCIGRERLAEELFIYSSGLFPLFGLAATTVRLYLLSLYEAHLVPLGPNLQPALSGFLTGVLSGLDATSDYYQRIITMLDQVRASVNPAAFYGSVWKCVDENALVRLPAINLILGQYDRKLPMEDQLHLLGPDLDLVVGALCACFRDGSVLVQRAGLDLLVAGFPLHEPPLGKDDMITVATAALCVVLRRDVSLNRRLFSWLLGSEVHTSSRSTSSLEASTKTKDLSYFAAHGKNAIVMALKRWLSRTSPCPSSEKSSSLEAFRIVAAVLEKPEIGACLVDDIFLDILRALYHDGQKNDVKGKAKGCSDQGEAQQSRKGSVNENDQRDGDGHRVAGLKNWTQDFLKVANLIFGVLEPDFVWSQCNSLFADAVRARAAERASVQLDSSLTELPDICDGELNGFEGRRERRALVRAVGSTSDLNRISEVCELICFLLDLLAFQSGPGANGSVGEYLLDLLSRVISLLASHHSWLSSREVTDALDMCESVLEQTQPSTLGSGAIDRREGDQDGTPQKRTVSTVEGGEEDGEATVEDGARVDACARDFVDFFASFVASNIFAGDGEIDRLFDALCAKASDGMGKLGGLERLLRSALDLDRSISTTSTVTSSSSTATMTTAASSFNAWSDEERLDLIGTRKRVIRILVSAKAGVNAQALTRWTPAFKACCRLLVRFSSFPTYVSVSALAGSPKSYSRLKRMTSDQPATVSSVPKWLRALICGAAFLQVAEFRIHAAAVEAIVDLAALLINHMEVEKNLGAGSSATRPSGSSANEGEDTVSVVIRPLMREPEFRALMVDTHLTQVLAHLLWSHIDCAGSPETVDSVSLLQRMYTVLPSRELVQNCLCETLADPNTGERVVAAQRFAVYWHYTRELQKRTPSSALKNLERCVLLMLENLGSDSSVLKSCSEGWLMHALHQGDVARLFDPVFLILLDPGTARASIQRYLLELVMSKDQQRKGEQDEKEVEQDDDDDDDDGDQEGSMVLCQEARETAVDQPSDQGSGRKLHGGMKKCKSMPILEGHSDVDTVEEDIVSQHLLEGSPWRMFPAHSLDYTNSISDSNDIISTFEDRLHSSLLVYSDVPDLAQVKYALGLMHSAVMAHPSSVLRSLVSTNLSSAHTPRASELQSLLARHRRSIRGLPFVGKLEPEETSTHRGMTLIEILIQCCLNFLRSCCPLQRDSSDVNWNAEVRLAAVDLLSISFLELMEMVKINGHGFASYVGDLLIRCKVQKIVLRSLASSVQRVKHRLLTPDEVETSADEDNGEVGEDIARAGETRGAIGSTANALSEMLLEFNEGGVEVDIGGFGGTGRSFPEALQINLLRLLHSLIILENTLANVQQQFCSPTWQKSSNDVSGSSQHQQFAHITFVAPTSSLRYMVGQPIPAQPLFLRSVLNVLRQEKLRHLHGFWLATINASLPYFGKTLGQIAVLLAKQICFNLESVQGVVIEREEERVSRCRQIPPDYVVRLLESLSTLCHYCLLEGPVPGPSSSSLSTHHAGTLSRSSGGSHIQSYTASMFPGMPSAWHNPTLVTHQPLVSSTLSSKTSTLGSTTQIINNLINVFIPSMPLKAISDAGMEGHSAADALMSARKALTSVLPRIIMAMAVLWKSAKDVGEDYSWVLGHPRDVKNHVTDFVSPIAVSQGTNFMLAITVAWQQGRQRTGRHHLGDRCSNQHPVSSPSKNDEAIVERWVSVAAGKNVNADQAKLVTLVSAIKSLPPDKIVQMVTQLIGQGYGVLPAAQMLGTTSGASPLPAGSGFFNASPAVNHTQGENPLLEFFRCYVERCASNQLIGCWPSLSLLVREALAVAANAASSSAATYSSVDPVSTAAVVANSTISHVFCVLWTFIQKVSALPERKDQRELQDLSVRVLDHLGQMAGLCLEQTAWLRPRTVVVKPDVDAVTSDTAPSGRTDEELRPTEKSENVELAEPAADVINDAVELSIGAADGLEADVKNIQLAVTHSDEVVEEESRRAVVRRRIIREAERAIADQCLGALTLLSECVASFLDILYASDEKERIVPILTSLLGNVTPYLRNHSRANMARHRACARLLSGVSSFPYARKAWKKDALDLLLDPAFFQMDLPSLRHWTSVLDNLVAQEKLIFKDLLNRFPVGTSGSLSIFSSREAEAEQRTLLLKRIAFLLFCSDSDQYQQFMPNLQEKLGECLKWASASANAGPGPTVQSAVFLCFRVLLLRASSPHLSALWPTIITELLQILLQIEQDLSTDSEEFSSHLKRLSTLETTFVTSNGLQAHNNPGWLSLYLSACKLLELALTLPANRLPQFQLYAWAFVGSPEHVDSTSSSLLKASSSTGSLVNGDLSLSSTAVTSMMSKPQRASHTRSPTSPTKSQNSHAMSEDLTGGFVTIDEGDLQAEGEEGVEGRDISIKDEDHAMEAESWQEESSRLDIGSLDSDASTVSLKSAIMNGDKQKNSMKADCRKHKDIKFLPHMARIAQLMRAKYAPFGCRRDATLSAKSTRPGASAGEGQLLLTKPSIKSIGELAAFFDTWGGSCGNAAVLVRHRQRRGPFGCLTRNLAEMSRDGTTSPAGESSGDLLVTEIERVLEADFLEKLML